MMQSFYCACAINFDRYLDDKNVLQSNNDLLYCIVVRSKTTVTLEKSNPQMF
jgi:hypothetical protein